MGLKNRGFSVVLFSAALLLLIGEVWAAEFSANEVTQSDGRERQGKVYVKGDRMRRETSSNQGMITIYHHKEKRILMLMPERMVYMEMPVTEEMTRELLQLSQERAAMKLLGTETINGYLTDKYETSFKDNGGYITHYMWVSRKLDKPIKITSPDGSFLMEYRDIKEGGVPDQIFEVPPGYRNMNGGGPKRQ